MSQPISLLVSDHLHFVEIHSTHLSEAETMPTVKKISDDTLTTMTCFGRDGVHHASLNDASADQAAITNPSAEDLQRPDSSCGSSSVIHVKNRRRAKVRVKGKLIYRV